MRCICLGFVCAALLGAIPVGCAETDGHEPVPAVTYIGVVQGTEVRIAIVQSARALQAYVCGQGPSLESHTRWFQGVLDERDAGAAELENDGWQLRVYASPTTMSGELLAPGGETLPWTAERVPDDAAKVIGLYESYELGCRTGVIVWQAQGSDCPSQGVWCDESGERGQVTPAKCGVDGTVVVRGGPDSTELVVERVQSP